MCLFDNYYVRPFHVAKKPDLMDLIQVEGTGLHIAWEK